MHPSDPSKRFEVIQILLRSFEKIIRDAIEIILHLNFDLSLDNWNENIVKVVENFILKY